MTGKKPILHRIVIYPKDVEIITGRGNRASQALLQKLRKSLGKEKHQAITVQEFCSYIGIPEKMIQGYLI